MIVPIDSYTNLRSIMVKDAAEGEPIPILVDEVRARDFRGRREVDIIQARGSEFVPYNVCGPHKTGTRTFRAIEATPNNLDDWMGIPPYAACPLPPGQYRIITTTYATGPFGAEISGERSSNLFTIRPKG